MIINLETDIVNDVFFKLTDEQISRGLKVIESKYYEYKSTTEQVGLRYSFLVRLAVMLVDCDKDRTLMRLKYADEIKDIVNYIKNIKSYSAAQYLIRQNNFILRYFNN
jgi:hypothetical protein